MVSSSVGLRQHSSLPAEKNGRRRNVTVPTIVLHGLRLAPDLSALPTLALIAGRDAERLQARRYCNAGVNPRHNGGVNPPG
jgi:hypothetical protein